MKLFKRPKLINVTFCEYCYFPIESNMYSYTHYENYSGTAIPFAHVFCSNKHMFLYKLRLSK